MTEDEHSEGKAIIGLLLMVGMGLYLLAMFVFT